MKYPEFAKELEQLLAADQEEKKVLARLYFRDAPGLAEAEAVLKANTKKRTDRMLEILNEIRQPSLSRIGKNGAEAISVLAVHADSATLERVLDTFVDSFEREPNDTYHSAIPSMTDLLTVFNREPQSFGTQWFFNNDKWPVLYPIQDFDTVNERRATYDIEPLRWPKSLAIPETEQPWLELPLSEAEIRFPTEAEYQEFAKIQN